jgi:hypothetical protein
MTVSYRCEKHGFSLSLRYYQVVSFLSKYMEFEIKMSANYLFLNRKGDGVRTWTNKENQAIGFTRNILINLPFIQSFHSIV